MVYNQNPMRVDAIIGTLPFSGRKGRPLKVSARALTIHQSMSESAHAQQLIGWLRLWSTQVPEFAHTYHVANEHNGDAVQKIGRNGKLYWYSSSASRRKAEGVRPGMLDLANHSLAQAARVGRVPDLLGPWSGLFIELKVRDNDLTSDPDAVWDQTRELAWLRTQNKSAHVVWSWAEAAALHAWYFNVKRRDLWRSIGPTGVYLMPRLGGHDRRCGCDVNLAIAAALGSR